MTDCGMTNSNFERFSRRLFLCCGCINPASLFSTLAGTTKRKELHGTTCIRALSASWGEKLDGNIFHTYKFDFSCTIVSEIYSGFILLIESKLDDDVGNIELDLFLVAKKVKSSVSSSGQVHLDAEQVQACCVLNFQS